MRVAGRRGRRRRAGQGTGRSTRSRDRRALRGTPSASARGHRRRAPLPRGPGFRTAGTRAQQILRETADAITPRPTLETDQLLSGTDPCLINPNDTSDKRVQVTLAYWLRGISPQDNASVAQQVLRYWRHKGYAISSTKGLRTDAPSVYGATPSDDFLISLETSSNGAMFIGTTSPCIWPKGTPPPS